MRRAGFTVMEILAVVVVMGLLSAIGLPVLVRWAGTAREQEWFGRLEGAERMVRHQAFGHGAVLLLRSDGLEVRDPATGATRNLVRVPTELHLTWERPAGGEIPGLLVYDQQGRSPDVILHAQVSGQNFWATLSGLTGEWSALRTHREPAP